MTKLEYLSIELDLEISSFLLNKGIYHVYRKEEHELSEYRCSMCDRLIIPTDEWYNGGFDFENARMGDGSWLACCSKECNDSAHRWSVSSYVNRVKEKEGDEEWKSLKKAKGLLKEARQLLRSLEV